MKKAISLILVLLLCAALPCLAETDNLLQRVYDANTGEALRANHESRLSLSTEKDHPEVTRYQDIYYEIAYIPNWEGVRVRTNDYDYLAMDEGGFRRYISLEDAQDPWQFYSERLLGMEIISVEEEGDTLVMTVRLPKNIATDFYPEAVESREVHVLDAETLELKSFRSVAVMPDGSEETFYEETIQFDVERAYTEAIEAIEKHLFEEEYDTRTTTFIFDDDKPCKRTYVYETPVGDGCISSTFSENGYLYEIDPERGEPSNEALDNDAVYYMVRVMPEQEEQTEEE